MKEIAPTGHLLIFFFNDTATTEIYTLSLHDALPISAVLDGHREAGNLTGGIGRVLRAEEEPGPPGVQRHHDLPRDRKSTRLNSSHANISYAVFCLKKKQTTLSAYFFSFTNNYRTRTY